jgi:anti-sigma factor RsiW
MLRPHLTRDAAEQYILGALPPEKAAALEAHTLECEPCAVLLQQEALLEEQVREVAAAFPREDRVLRPARWHVRRAAAGAVGALLAAAASLAILLHTGGPRPSILPGPVLPEEGLALVPDPGASQAVVACPDLATQSTCTQSATERGLLVLYPGGLGEVPRYEARTGLPEGALRSRPASL